MTSLLERAARYVGIPSVSGAESAIADDIEAELRASTQLEVTRLGDNVVARTTGTASTRVILAGHLDTVPGEPRLEVRDGAVHGLGACDMKGTVAIFVDLAVAGGPYACEVTWVLYAREEIGRVNSGLLEVAAARPDLLAGDVAILGEPTSCVVEAGCQGSVQVRLVLRGARAHTARPSRGRNAIHRLAGPLELVAQYVPRRVVMGAVTYEEQRQVVGISGGVAGNVVPDEASMIVNQRVAPDRTSAEAIAELAAAFSSFLEDADTFEVMDAAPPAPPGLEHPVLAALVERSGADPRGKLGFTDVATFAERGTPAANFGAGDPQLAHHAGEFVTLEELERCRSALGALLTATP